MITVGGMSAVLMNALLIPVIPDLPELLDTDLANATWVVTSTLIASAVLTPIIGRLADLYGKRRVYLATLAVLAVGAVISALAPSLAPMLVGRVLQGAGVGIIPIGISILRDVMPPAQLPVAIALVSGSLGIGSSIGLPLATFVIAIAGWKSVFWAAAILTVVLIVLSAVMLPRTPPVAAGRLDWLGAAGLALWLLPVLLLLTQGPRWGLSPITAGLAVASLTVLAGWVVHQLRSPSPLVDLRLAAQRPILLTNLASVALGFAMFASNLVFPQALRAPVETGSGFGLPLLEAGVALSPLGLVMLLFSPVGARVSMRHGPRTSLVAGALCVAVAYGFAGLMRAELWQLLVAIVLVGVGVGFGYAAVPSLIVDATPRAATTSANAINALMRTIGTSVSSAAVGAVLASATVTVGAGQWPTAGSITSAFAIAAGAAIMAAILAAMIPRGERRGAPV